MKKRNIALTILTCVTLAGCANMSDAMDVGAETEQVPAAIPTLAPTPTEPFVYGKTSPCLADSGKNAGSECIASGIDRTDKGV